MRKSMLCRKGFTLIELLMTVAIFAVLLAVAAPSYGRLIGQTHNRTARSALNASLSQARLAAVGRGMHVVVCPSGTQTGCDRTTRWQHGWIAFVDVDHDGGRSTDEPLVVAAQAQPDGVAIVTSGGRLDVDFQPDGTADGTNLSLTICDRAAGPEAALQLVVSNAGRTRNGTPTSDQAEACLRAAG